MEAAQPPGQPVYGQPPPRRTHPLSIISFIFSLLWLFWLGSIVGVITGHIARRDLRRDPSASGDGLAIAGLVLGYIGIGVLVLVLAVAMVAGTSGTSGGSPLGENCITTNFNVELCGQDAVDHCESWQENQAQIQEDSEEMAADARRMNREAKRDARRYGGSARDYGYDPDAEEDAYGGMDDGFSRKTDEICQQILGS